MSNGSITGGIYTASSNVSLSNVSLNVTSLTILGGGNVTFNGPTITNNGTIKISNVGAQSILNFTSNTTIGGTGDILLNTYSPNAILSTTGAATITISANQTIHGVGEVDAAIINNGMIISDFLVGPRTLLIQTSNITNNNVIGTANGSILAISGMTINQAPTAPSPTPTAP